MEIKGIIEQVAREESNIGVEFNTNGAYRCKEWWHDLGKILNREEDIVIFAIVKASSCDITWSWMSVCRIELSPGEVIKPELIAFDRVV